MEVIFKTWFYGYKELNTEKDTIGRGVEAKIKSSLIKSESLSFIRVWFGCLFNCGQLFVNSNSFYRTDIGF
jgi:hypothetical protein